MCGSLPPVTLAQNPHWRVLSSCWSAVLLSRLSARPALCLSPAFHTATSLAFPPIASALSSLIVLALFFLTFDLLLDLHLALLLDFHLAPLAPVDILCTFFTAFPWPSTQGDQGLSVELQAMKVTLALVRAPPSAPS